MIGPHKPVAGSPLFPSSKFLPLPFSGAAHLTIPLGHYQPSLCSSHECHLYPRTRLLTYLLGGRPRRAVHPWLLCLTMLCGLCPHWGSLSAGPPSHHPFMVRSSPCLSGLACHSAVWPDPGFWHLLSLVFSHHHPDVFRHRLHLTGMFPSYVLLLCREPTGLPSFLLGQGCT